MRRLEVTVSRLRVSVEETGEVLGLARYRGAARPGDGVIADDGRVHPM